jgi:FixJ family two-component response regulator
MVLFVTGYVHKFEMVGATDPLIMKPFRPAALAEAVHSALQQSKQQRGR